MRNGIACPRDQCRFSFVKQAGLLSDWLINSLPSNRHRRKCDEGVGLREIAPSSGAIPRDFHTIRYRHLALVSFQINETLSIHEKHRSREAFRWQTARKSL
jgi:hypothetical protein